MSRSKIFSVLIVILLLSLSLIGCSKVQVVLPNEADLKNIVLSDNKEENNKYITITDNEEIKKIIDIIKLNSKKTNRESLGDTPTNVDYYIKLEFSYSEGGSSVAYVYKIKDICYIEQPYNGTWEIAQEIYEDIDALLKDK
ncbi:DUF5301 domain-containing protein [Clostridium ihumii]|uniref:DUF5301 domain-containing protein n=1 Tax=Clostridium ihumii TaxID=1470356 RepID=UPI003D32DBCF